MDKEVAKAIADVSKRMNEVERKLEAFLLGKHEENKEAISTTDGGVIDIADIVSIQDEAISELAEIITANMEERG